MNPMCLIVLVILIGGCAAPTSERKPALPPIVSIVSAPEVPIPENLREPVKRAEDIGRQLYYLDKVTAMGTDALLERIGRSGTKGLGGYLPLREVDEEGRPKDSWVVMFFTAEDSPRISHEVRVFAKVGKVTEYSKVDPPRKPTNDLLMLIRVRQVAISALPEVVQPINPVLLPSEVDGEEGMVVYLLAGTTKPDVAVFGKHYRAVVARDGSVVRKISPMSKTVLEVPTRDPKGEVKALFVSHILTDWPLETHVFTSMRHKLPIYVSTKRGVWKVNGDKVSLISDRPPEEMQ